MEGSRTEPQTYAFHMERLTEARDNFFEASMDIFCANPEERDFDALGKSSEHLTSAFSDMAKFIIEDTVDTDEKINLILLLQKEEDKKRVDTFNEMVGVNVCKPMGKITIDPEFVPLDDNIIQTDTVQIFGSYLSADLHSCLEYLDRDKKSTHSEGEDDIEVNVHVQQVSPNARDRILGSISIAAGVAVGIIVGKKVSK
jgi:hypothetical protein